MLFEFISLFLSFLGSEVVFFFVDAFLVVIVVAAGVVGFGDY